MKTVVFVAPYFRPVTLRFVSAVASLPQTRVGVVSQDAIESMPGNLRAKIDGHYQVSDAMSASELAKGVRAMQAHFGHVDRLLGTLEHIQEQLALVRQWLGIEGLQPVESSNFRDKAQMKQVLRDAGLPVARHRRVSSEFDARTFADDVGFPLVVKPIAGAAAVGTYRVTTVSEMIAALSKLGPTDAEPVQLEEFMTGEERSFETISINGDPVWTSYTEYAPQPLHVLENSWIQWTVTLPREETSDDLEAIREPGLAAVRALGMQTGLTHMEWFRRPDGTVAISEVAARPPGAQIMTLNSYAHDADMYKAWARVMVHDEWELGPKKWATGCAFLRPSRAGRISAVRGVDEANAEIGPLVVESRLPTVGASTSSGYEGDGYVIVRAETTAEVRHALSVVVSKVRLETN